jgi:hypothetical protein
MHTPNLCNTLVLKRLIKDKKRRHSFEENLEVTCGRKFCSFCLKNFYDINFSTVKNDPNWNCPYCTSQCFCSRCRRQDQLTTVRGYLISLNLKDLAQSPSSAAKVFAQATPKVSSSSHPIDAWLLSNFEKTVRCSDLSNKLKESVYFLEPELSV